MKILLIDVDSVIPNIALMKISGYFKSIGADVFFKRLQIPYYPKRTHKVHTISTEGYDLSFASVVFEGSLDWVRDIEGRVIFGGTGFDLSRTLPDIVEYHELDYSLYPENDTSYGFISRGCIRNCKFCKVPKKEGGIRQVDTIDNIVRHKKVKFLDNNFLALPNHGSLLVELIDKQIKHQFNQGLDIRLINKNNSDLLSKLNYFGEYIFALDDVRYIEKVKEKLTLLSWRKDWGFKFFVYVHPDMEESNIVSRIEFLRREKCLPYVMRDISCFNDPKSGFYVDLAAWCNQPGIFKKLSFKEFLGKRHQTKNCTQRILASWKLYCT